jgi:hypothetical protein
MFDSPFQKLNRRNLRQKELLYEEGLDLSLPACSTAPIPEATFIQRSPHNPVRP